MGTTTFKHSFRPLMHSFHMGTNSSSPMITEPLKEVKTMITKQSEKPGGDIKLLLQKRLRGLYEYKPHTIAD